MEIPVVNLLEVQSLNRQSITYTKLKLRNKLKDRNKIKDEWNNVPGRNITKKLI